MPVFEIETPAQARRFQQWVDACNDLSTVTQVDAEPPTVTAHIGTEEIVLRLMVDTEAVVYVECDIAGATAVGANPRQAIGKGIQDLMTRARTARAAWLAITTS